MSQSKIIQAVLKSASGKKRDDIEFAWFEYLRSNLEFPFEAEVNLYSYSSVLKDGDIVKVTGVEDIVDMYGLLLKIKKGRSAYTTPLVELELVDKNSRNFEILEAYLEWAGD
ncbi:MAG: calcium-binding protein [Bacteroidales bacterium]|nr:calcium-binding protein [Bacteroidales bacterium]